MEEVTHCMKQIHKCTAWSEGGGVGVGVGGGGGGEKIQM